MRINRDNYESFFLLYVDNELSAEEVKEVEQFVQLHPDLAQELDTLMQLRLVPDKKIQFPGREMLYRSEPARRIKMDATNYEEYLLSYLDNELNAEEIVAIESFLIENPSVQEEMEWLKKARLEPEMEIVFPDKQVLYRSVDEPAKIIRVYWWRVAVAAVLLLSAGIWSVNEFMFRPDTGSQFAQEKPSDSGKTAGPDLAANTEKAVPVTEPGQAPSQNPVVSAETSSQPEEIHSANVTQLESESRENQIAYRKADSQPETGRTPESPLKENTYATLSHSNNTLVNNNPPVNPDPKVPVDRSIDMATAVVPVAKPEMPDDLKTNYATEALQQEIYGIEITQEPEPPARKGLLRGLVRKANRVLNRVTDPDANSDGIRVASFQIARAK